MTGKLQIIAATAAPGHVVLELQRKNAGRTHSKCGRHCSHELHPAVATAAPGQRPPELQAVGAGRTYKECGRQATCELQPSAAIAASPANAAVNSINQMPGSLSFPTGRNFDE
jgi:hypothetical protein